MSLEDSTIFGKNRKECSDLSDFCEQVKLHRL